MSDRMPPTYRRINGADALLAPHEGLVWTCTWEDGQRVQRHHGFSRTAQPRQLTHQQVSEGRSRGPLFTLLSAPIYHLVVPPPRSTLASPQCPPVADKTHFCCFCLAASPAPRAGSTGCRCLSSPGDGPMCGSVRVCVGMVTDDTTGLIQRSELGLVSELFISNA